MLIGACDPIRWCSRFTSSGIKHAREIATISYRSGPEWEQRFGRRKAKQHGKPAKMSFHPE